MTVPLAALQSLGRAVSYRAASLTAARSPRSVYASFKRGMIFAADTILRDEDPVFDFVDWESLGAALDLEVSMPLTAADRSTTAHEKLCLALLLKLQDPGTILELGTYRGATTQLLFRNAPEHARLFTFDVPSDIDRRDVDRSRLIDLAQAGLADDFDREFVPQSERVTQLYADLTRVDWREIRILPRPDFVFIDADHSYEGCLRDTQNVLAWTGDEAMVVWHDAAWRNFDCIQANYGVHDSIVAATPPEARAYTFRLARTSLIVRAPRHQALLREHLLAP
jgi:predicted O-methyltransferase YrrM